MKKHSSIIFTVIFFLLFTTKFFPQSWYSQGFYIIEYPHSVRNLGMGMNGVVSESGIDALTYNPANLVFIKEPSFSFYHQGLQMAFGGIPMNDYSVYKNLGSAGSFGIDYNDWNMGDMAMTSPDSPDPVEILKSYQRSIAVGYAMEINNNLGIGASFRYGFAAFAKIKFNAYLLSIGAVQKFRYLNKNWRAAISIMNLGPAIKYASGDGPDGFDSPPSFLSIGLNVNAVDNEFITMPLSVSISKPFDKRDDHYNGQSSFKTLFTDWKDFPRDASLSPGAALEWKELNLGGGFYYSQNFYVGDYSSGIKSGLVNFFTHGFEISAGYKAIKISAGYSGVWHNAQYYNYYPWRFPYETFQFSLSANPEIFSGRRTKSYNDGSPVKLKNIIVSAGAGQLLRIGKAKSIVNQGINIEQKNNIDYAVESAFYLSRRSALVMSFSYNSTPFDVRYYYYSLISMKIETLTLTSSYRYHPVDGLRNMFLQAGLGVVRFNPVVPTTPKYYYSTELSFAAGYNFELPGNMILSPLVKYDLILQDAWENRSKIAGNNQFNLGMRLGYKF